MYRFHKIDDRKGRFDGPGVELTGQLGDASDGWFHCPVQLMLEALENAHTAGDASRMNVAVEHLEERADEWDQVAAMHREHDDERAAYQATLVATAMRQASRSLRGEPIDIYELANANLEAAVALDRGALA